MPIAPTLMELALLCAPIAIDGDTLKDCHGVRWRIAGIDAPEMPGHCRRGRRCTPGDPFAAQRALAGLIKGLAVRCRRVDANARMAGFQAADIYGRPVAECSAGGRELGAAMVARGRAVWRY